MRLRNFVRKSCAHSASSLSGYNKARRRPIVFEPLEVRNLLAADLRPIDGWGNNLQHPEWGSAGATLLRNAAAAYADGISTPAGVDRASPRAISNLVSAQTVEDTNAREMSAMIYAWGQFLDHDLDLTTASNLTESFPIAVPSGDPWFDPASTGTQTIGLSRSQYDPTTGLSTLNPRQQLNSLTAFVDGSQIYGSDAVRAAALRTFSGGKLKTSEGNLLPYNTGGLTNDNPFGAPADSLFVAGDSRANENVELTTLQTLFLREHNRLADSYAKQHPDWTDEQVYQQARRIMIGELQAITYREFLPALLGRSLGNYHGYDPHVNPGIANEFSTAAFRLGHSLLGDDIEFLDNRGNEIHDAVELRDAFFNPSVVSETGIDSILKYLASDRAQELDTQVVDDVRNFLFGLPGQGGLDLASLNIQRGRDHGLSDYNTTRVAYGLRPVTSFEEISQNPATQQALREAYGSVDKIDLWVGGLAEDHVRGGSLGPLFTRIVTDQFTRLRDGDRFWYQRTLSDREIKMVENTTLADVIRMNTTTSNLQENVFFFKASISGTVFADSNGNGRQDRREDALAGIVVELRDSIGTVVATTTSRRDGSYTFEGLDLGIYQIHVLSSSSVNQTTRDVHDVKLTKGAKVTGIDLGVRLRAHTVRTATIAAVDELMLGAREV